MSEKRVDDFLRGNGYLPTISVNANSIAEGWHKAVLGCYEQGLRIETPKQRDGMPLGFDAHITVNVRDPLSDPQKHVYGIHDDDRGLMQYKLEVSHGIHDGWKKDPNNPNDTRWGYTYHERFSDQIPFLLQKIFNDFEKKGRATGRDYFFSIWRPEEDSILEQEDPPCFQNGQFRLIPDSKGELHLSYLTHWRSRDLMKAWNENNVAQAELHQLVAQKISNRLERKVSVRNYIDTSNSLHIYGAYLKELEPMIEKMKGMDIENIGFPLFTTDEKELKRLISAQSDARTKGHGTNLPESALEKLGYDLKDYPYPTEWDTWPDSWNDENPDPAKLRMKLISQPIA